MGDGFIPDDVEEFLDEHEDFYATEECRVRFFVTRPLWLIALQIRCELTGHEMPARLADVLQHFNGKKYKKMVQTRLKMID